MWHEPMLIEYKWVRSSKKYTEMAWPYGKNPWSNYKTNIQRKCEQIEKEMTKTVVIWWRWCKIERNETLKKKKCSVHVSVGEWWKQW